MSIKLNDANLMTMDWILKFLDQELACIPLNADMLPDKTGILSLLFLNGTATRMPGLIGEKERKTLQVLITNGISPVISAKHHDEASAMRELLTCLNPTGESQCFYHGSLVPSLPLYTDLGITPHDDYDADQALSLCCISTAMAAWLYGACRSLAKVSDICVGLNLEAVRGETGAYDERLHKLGRPFKGQIESAENIRSMIQDSEFTTEKARLEFGYDTGPRCQDAICLRAAPQTHGGARDCIDRLGHVLSKQVNEIRAEKNPVLTHALNLVATAMADLGNISERRGFRLLDSHMSYGLPDVLVYDNSGYNHGLPVLQETATALLGELKLMALPPVSGADASSVSSMQFLTAKKALEMVPFLQKILAVELMLSAQGMDLAKRELSAFQFGKGSRVAYAKIRESLDVCKENRYLIDDMTAAYRLVADHTLVRAVESAIFLN